MIDVWGIILVGFWTGLPRGSVVRLQGASAEAIALSLEPLPDSAPAIVTYYPKSTASLSEAVISILSELQTVAVQLFPAWLPGAERLDGPGGAGIKAVRALAAESAAATENFGPFLADLAEHSLTGAASGTQRFAAEVRAAELAKIIAASFNRSHTALLIHPPTDLSSADAHTLSAASEWLANHGRVSVWLAGALPSAFDRFQAVCMTLDATLQSGELGNQLVPLESPERPAILYPPIAGSPHPASAAEQALEKALAGCDWAKGRAWNQTYQMHTLANPIRVDLLWAEERFIVEVDGPDHCGALKFEGDRRRDVHLQLEGFAVLRFTNAQVLDDLATVLSYIGRFIQYRRNANQDGGRHGGG